MRQLNFGHGFEQSRAAVILEPKSSHTSGGLPASSGLILHLLADLNVYLEEFCHAAIQADGLALVEVTFPVVVGDALVDAGLSQTAIPGFGSAVAVKSDMKRIMRCVRIVPVEHVRNHFDFGFRRGDFLL